MIVAQVAFHDLIKLLRIPASMIWACLHTGAAANAGIMVNQNGTQLVAAKMGVLRADLIAWRYARTMPAYRVVKHLFLFAKGPLVRVVADSYPGEFRGTASFMRKRAHRHAGHAACTFFGWPDVIVGAGRFSFNHSYPHDILHFIDAQLAPGIFHVFITFLFHRDTSSFVRRKDALPVIRWPGEMFPPCRATGAGGNSHELGNGTCVHTGTASARPQLAVLVAPNGCLPSRYAFTHLLS